MQHKQSRLRTGNIILFALSILFGTATSTILPMLELGSLEPVFLETREQKVEYMKQLNSRKTAINQERKQLETEQEALNATCQAIIQKERPDLIINPMLTMENNKTNAGILLDKDALDTATGEETDRQDNINTHLITHHPELNILEQSKKLYEHRESLKNRGRQVENQIKKLQEQIDGANQQQEKNESPEVNQNSPINSDIKIDTSEIHSPDAIPWKNATKYGIAIAGAIGIAVLVYKLINYYKSNHPAEQSKRKTECSQLAPGLAK